MTNQEEKIKKMKEELEKSKPLPPLYFLKPYLWSVDGIHTELYERGKTYTKYPPKLLEDVKKEPVPVATYEGKVTEPYENKLFPKGEDKAGDALGEFLESLTAAKIKDLCELKGIDTKKLSKQEQIEKLKYVK